LAFVVAQQAYAAPKPAVVASYAAPYAPITYSSGYTGYPYYSGAYAYDGTYKAPAFAYSAYSAYPGYY